MCGALLPLPRLRLPGAHSDKFDIKQLKVSNSDEKKIANRYMDLRLTPTLSKLGHSKLH